MSNVIDLSAKLLANEDISVRRANTPTASFDIKSRVLTLPMWQEMTPAIEQMLVGHEVGHALYTTDEYSEPMKENPSIRSYMNVLEDVRIEKMIKQKYPGIRKHMAQGYKELNERDFFEVDGQDVNKMLLIDRINLWFKVGLSANINFNPEEKQFVVRAERTETIQDVIELAQEVFAYSKEEYEKQKQEWEEQAALEADEDGEDEYDDWEQSDDSQPEDPFEEDEESTWEDGGIDSQDSSEETEEEETDGSQYMGSEQGEGDLESKTDRAFAKNLADLADTDTEYKYWKFQDQPSNMFVDYKTVYAEIDEGIQKYREGYDYENGAQHKRFLDFKSETTKNVNYLVKEFEMRKSATEYKRTSVSKTGQLDMKKIFGYQINDDLFKRVAIVKEGKNHGMMILLDWSGSMHNVIQDTIKQVINLAMFCQRVQIPYKVLAFSSQYFRKMTPEQRVAYRESLPEPDDNDIATTRGTMLELFSNKMTSAEFMKMAEVLCDERVLWVRNFALGGTPLNEALVWVYNNLGNYIRQNNIEKMSFITLTDGEGQALAPANGSSFRERQIKEYGKWDEDTQTRTQDVIQEYKHFVRDDITKKEYRWSIHNTKQTTTLLKMIKDRYNTKNIGFYICQNKQRDLYWAVKSNVPTIDPYNMIPDIRKSFRTDGYFGLSGGGRDELFIIPNNRMRITEGKLVADSDMTARKLASNFGKFLNQKKTSRVLLNKFVGWVA
jgi:hypothetical protein